MSISTLGKKESVSLIPLLLLIKGFIPLVVRLFRIIVIVKVIRLKSTGAYFSTKVEKLNLAARSILIMTTFILLTIKKTEMNIAEKNQLLSY